MNIRSKHLFSLFGQLGTDVSLAPAQQVGRNQVTQHNSTLVGCGHLQPGMHTPVSPLATPPPVTAKRLFLSTNRRLDKFLQQAGAAVLIMLDEHRGEAGPCLGCRCAGQDAGRGPE